MMKSKTCGECKNYDIVGQCNKVRVFNLIHDYTLACIKFEAKNPTNGDRIRQDGNRELAEYFVYETGAMWASTLIVDITFDTYKEAIEATEEYLNAPAESEVNNG